ncbi:hypothetical protein [Caudoviricetes sp.]|nr:hypothetical protein [Caudoviricetes sp.]
MLQFVSSRRARSTSPTTRRQSGSTSCRWRRRTRNSRRASASSRHLR